MPRATWNGALLAESDTTEIVEGTVYFPPESLNREYFSESDHTTRCPWKGTASYLNVSVDGQWFPNAAWYYPDASPAAKKIKGYVAFYTPISVEG